MKYNINKELFEAVMGTKVVSITINDYIFFEMEDGYKPDYGISVDTFFFKCKEWALKQGYELLSYSTKRGDCYCNVYTKNDGWEDYKFNSYSTSEQQAVFNATQWILDNEGIK